MPGMEYKRCEKCGFRFDLDEGLARCKACGASLTGEDGGTETVSTSLAALREPVQPANTGGEADSVGAYGMAGDASWDDPSQQRDTPDSAAELNVPEDVRERHKALTARRNNFIGLAVAAAGTLFIALFLASC